MGAVDPVLLTILAFGFAMAGIAMVGGLLVLLPGGWLERLLPVVVAFSAGSLLGGAVYFMVPHALAKSMSVVETMGWLVVGFSLFLGVDLVLEWRDATRPSSVRPLGPLLLIADGMHNFLGGLAIGAVFVADYHAGVAAWAAAALHEVPQEIGDFGAIVHAGFSPRRALVYNVLSALTFPVGGLVAYGLADAIDVGFLVAVGAGSFVYIAAVDLLPEIKRSPSLPAAGARFGAFLLGTALLFAGALYAADVRHDTTVGHEGAE